MSVEDSLLAFRAEVNLLEIWWSKRLESMQNMNCLAYSCVVALDACLWYW